MSEYRRCYQSGGYYFFTLVTYQRCPIFSDAEKVEQLKIAINKVWQYSSFNYWVEKGLYEKDWGSMESLMFAEIERAE